MEKIWTFQVPVKVKNFVWRSCVNCLPTTVALRKKHVTISDICLGCSNVSKDTFHALVKCPLAKDVWKLTDLGDLSEVVDSFRDWWKLAVQRQNMGELNMTAIILWSLWNSRNELILNGRRKSSSWTFNAALHTLIQ